MTTTPTERQPARRPDRPSTTLEVLRTERLTSRMVRVVLGGTGLAGYRHNDFTDRYVKLQFPSAPGAEQGDRPTVRTYTVRGFDPVAGELWLDVVQHGTEGVAGPWAAAVQPGETISFFGPGGAYAPDPTAAWHLFVGDPAAFPAIASAIEALPPRARIVAVLAAHDEEETGYFDLPAHVEVHWLLGADAPPLDRAVEGIDVPEGVPQVFAHGELDQIRALRTHLTADRGVPKEQLSISGYWRRGLTEEAFQVAKRER